MKLNILGIISLISVLVVVLLDYGAQGLIMA